MLRLAFPTALFALLAACVTTEPTSEENRTLEFNCQETVVIGKLTNEETYERVPIENDLIGHGWMEATLHVRRTVHGAKISGDVPIRYFGHTYIREDRSFMFVLSHDETGYEIEIGQLMSVGPKAVSVCR